MKGLFGAVLVLTALNMFEDYVRRVVSWLPPLGKKESEFQIEQLRLYAQLLTAIFSIYFATIGIILSSGYTRLRGDIVRALVNEHVGSTYSKVLVFAAIFCLAATASPMLGLETGLFVYVFGTGLTLVSALALFPLGQRLFNFFDLNLLVHSEILPRIVRHIECAASPRNSISLAAYHSSAARQCLAQLSYIDDRLKTGKEGLEDKVPALHRHYTLLLLLYLEKKHQIDQESYWFPRRIRHKQWFLAGDTTTSMALESSSQHALVESSPDYVWLENEVVGRLTGHVELAFQVGNFELALALIGKFELRATTYAQQFQFDLGMQELKTLKAIIEKGFEKAEFARDDTKAKITMMIADAWTALGSNFCFEFLRRMVTFEKVFQRFLESDEWTKKSLRALPPFLQADLAIVVERIQFEKRFEGQRLSKAKYVQQLAVQRLLQHYAAILPVVSEYFHYVIPDFVTTLTKLDLPKAATQVTLNSLHSYWKLPRWFGDVASLLDRYHAYNHYADKHYALPVIDTTVMSKQLVSARDKAVELLASAPLVKHILDSEYDEKLPDHFGQIYFELGEACISALEQNDESKLEKVLPIFLTLAFLAADSKFTDPAFKVDREYRLHLVSTVINDVASVLGFAILYGEYFANGKLSQGAIAKFNFWIGRVPDKHSYLKRMVLLSDPHGFSMSASPRNMIRMKWKMSFENRAGADGYGSRLGLVPGLPHPSKVVRALLGSFSDASHLFFAQQVLPQFEKIDFDISHQISDLARKLAENINEACDEDN